MSIGETVFVAEDFFFFSVSPADNPNYPQHLVSGFIFIIFVNFVLQWLLGSLSMLLLLLFRSCRNLLSLTL